MALMAVVYLVFKKFIDEFGKDLYAYVKGLVKRPPPPEKPLQRPPEPDPFVGRVSELEEILSQLESKAVVRLAGPGGVGKSTIVAKVVWTLLPERKPFETFSDGVLFHDFYHSPEAEQAFTTFATAFKEPLSGGGAESAARRVLSEKNALIVLEGCEQAKDIEKVLSVRGKCKVIMTSWVATPDSIVIGPLPEDDAKSLLARYSDLDESTSSFGEITDLVGCLPLALKIVGETIRFRNEPPGVLLEALQRSPLQALTPEDRQQKSIIVLLERNIARLGDDLIEALNLIGALAFSPIPIKSFHRLMNRNTDLDASYKIVGALKRESIVNFVTHAGKEEQSFQVSHVLMYVYIQEHSRKSINRPSLLSELLRDYTELFDAIRREDPVTSDVAGVLHREAAHVVQIVRQASRENEMLEPAFALVASASDHFLFSGCWSEAADLLKFGVEVAKSKERFHEEGTFRYELGKAYRSLGKYPEARKELTYALLLQRKLNNRNAIAKCLDELGNVSEDLGHLKEAVKFHGDSLKLHTDEENLTGIAKSSCNLGTAYMGIKQFKAALRNYRRALQLFRDLKDKRGETSALGNIGLLHQKNNEHEAAFKKLQTAHAIAKAIKARPMEAALLTDLGIVYAALNQKQKARESYEAACVIQEEIGDSIGRLKTEWNLGLLVAETNPIQAVKLMGPYVAHLERIRHPLTASKRNELDQISAKIIDRWH